MGADNVDVFQRLVFGAPPLKVQLPALVGLSVVYSLATFLAFSVFTPLTPEPSSVLPVPSARRGPTWT